MNWKIFDKEMSRKEFCKLCLYSGLGVAFSPAIMDLFKKKAFAMSEDGGKGFIPRKEASYYKKIDAKTIQCELCPRKCVLADGQKGFCRARAPEGGKHYTLVYGNPTAVHVDPIEKKPLFHFLPSTTAFSIATAGCNFRCKYCQNWEISQLSPEETENYNLPPQDVVNKAREERCPTIAYTYTEPSIFYEYMFDTAKLAKIAGIRNMYHSNGSLSQEPLDNLAYYLDAADIDLKGFTQDFYKDMAEGFLDVVLNTLKTLKRNNVWVEITNLVVPNYNDDLAKIKEMAIWIRDNLGKDTPLHFSRFFPLYKLANLPATPLSTLDSARKIAMDVGLNYVYIGNNPGNEGESTYCPQCKKPVIRRVGYSVLEVNIDSKGRSNCCKYPIAGVWS